jgi:hypothetical protein
MKHIYHGYGWDTFCGLTYTHKPRAKYPGIKQTLVHGEEICQGCRQVCLEVLGVEPGVRLKPCTLNQEANCYHYFTQG